MGPCAAGADNSFEADLCLPTRQEFNRAVARVAQIEAILAEGAEVLSTATRDQYAHERAQQQQLIDNYRSVRAWNKMPARKKASLEQELTPQRRWLLAIVEQRRLSATACKWSQKRESATKSTSRRREVLGHLEARLFRLLKSKRKLFPEAEIIREIYGLEQDRKSSNRLRQLQCAVNAKLRRNKIKVEIVRPKRGFLCLKGKMKRTRPWNEEKALERAWLFLLEWERSQNDQSSSAAPRPRQELARCREFLASTYPHGGEFESRKVMELCVARGFSGSTVQRALRAQNATRKLRGYGGRWYIHIPSCQELHLTKAA